MPKPDDLLVELVTKEPGQAQPDEEISREATRVGDSYTQEQVAEMLKCSVRTILELRKHEGLPWFEINRSHRQLVRIPRLEFEQWFRDRVRSLGNG